MFNKFIELSSGKTTSKVLATLLVVTLTFANFIMLGSYISNAVETNLNQDSSTNVANVKYDVYLEQEGKKEINKDINDEDLVLGISIKVENGGYFSEGKIELQDTNFRIKNYEDENNITIETIQSGNEKTLKINIVPIKSEDFNLSLLNMISSIKLTGKYTNNEGTTTNVESTKNVKVTWNSQNISEENNPINLEQEIITNKIYNIEGTNKRVIQILAKSGLENNCYPIKETNIKAYVPALGSEEVYPEEVLVASYDTIATNGKDSTEFGKKEEEKLGKWSYDQEEKAINIKIENSESNNNIKWEKTGEDKFVITYIYNENVDITKITSRIDNTISIYGEENTKLTKTSEIYLENLEEKGNIINTEIQATNLIYKSNMNIGEETEYAVKHTAELSYSKNLGKIKIKNDAEQFNISEEETIEANTYFKSTYINKNEMLKLFGENGNIKLSYIDSNNEIVELQTINKETEADESGTITINYGTDTKFSILLIETSEPISEGKLNIIHRKAIDCTGYEKEQIKQINGLNTSFSIEATEKDNNEIQIANTTKSAVINVVNPTTEIQIGIDKTNLSTAQTNNVNITATLKTNNLKYDIYTNPTIEIILPAEIEKVDIKNINVVNGNGLNKNNPDNEQYTDENGNKVIKVQLQGEQKTYTNTDTQVLINAEIQTSKFLPTLEKELIIKCTNGKETTYLNSTLNYATARTNIKLEAEQGILLANAISNYNGIEPEIVAFKNEEKTGLLNNKAENQTTAIAKGVIINNTTDKLENILVIGNLNNSMGLKLASGINVENAQVYYTKDQIVNKESAWVSEYSDDVTGYKIEISAIENTQIINFNYRITIPAQIESEKQFVIQYDVYTETEKISSPLIKLQTEKNDDEASENITTISSDELELTIETTPSTEEKLKSGQEIAINVTIKNLLEEKLTILESNATGETSEQNHTIVFNAEFSEGLLAKEAIIKNGEKTETKQLYANPTISIEEEIEPKASINILLKAKVEEETTIEQVISKISAVIRIPNEIGLDEDEEKNYVGKVEKQIVYNVKQYVAIEKITIPEELILNIGEKKEVEIILEPDGAAIDDVEMSIGDNTIARITEEGKIEGISEGETALSVKPKASETIKYCVIKVIDPNGTQKPQEPDDSEKPGDSDNTGDSGDQGDSNQDERTYKISGLAWLDLNDDGMIDETENLLKGITVKIKDVSKNEYLKDENNQVLSVTTDEKGKYEFANLEQGRYSIEFEYNKNKYRLTKTSNKDSVANLITQDGVTVIATDTLVIADKDIQNINIGLNLNPEFDLQLDKYISKVTVQNSDGTKIYDYNENKEKLAKIEINAKKLNGSTVIVEYTIAVTNNGDVSGYAKNIVDYLSPDLKFSSEMNTTWYQGADNNLYCTYLENQEIKPGETKAVKLILTKTMTNENTGLVNNSAEIYQAYNEYALDDINSLPNNKVEKENDYSSADIIISVATGGTILYIGIIIISMLTIGAGIYLINEKVINKKEII